MSIVISVENVSKQYRLGEVGTGTLSHDINRLWHRFRGNEDPYLKIGESNDRSTKDDSNYSWALHDVSFEVKQGEVLGIIGRNGAGKSTLLKILSRVTTPTTGEIKVKGRIASLLEVGTGFHPELTGRENIFLNGAILGMRKWEIAKKFDEIVEFSGCERYIDTPVKRYSSGMYVRLAFAVAAHLEPEILIIDEVLAVGDAEFQKKCLGKMKDVAGQGRTVLFVSHNMASVVSLCRNCMVLDRGRVDFIGETDIGVARYFDETQPQVGKNLGHKRNSEGSGTIRITEVWTANESGTRTAAFRPGEVVSVCVAYSFVGESTKLSIGIGIYAEDGTPISHMNSNLSQTIEFPDCTHCEAKCNFTLPSLFPSGYFLNISLRDADGNQADRIQRACKLQVIPIDFYGSGRLPPAASSPLLIAHQWEIQSK